MREIFVFFSNYRPSGLRLLVRPRFSGVRQQGLARRDRKHGGVALRVPDGGERVQGPVRGPLRPGLVP